MSVPSIRHLILATCIVSAAPLAAQAQSPTAIQPGMQVVDQSGQPVGTVKSVNNGELVVKTDKHEVLLQATSFTPHQGKLLFALTQAELNAQTEEAIAEANASLVAGTAVHGAGGTLAGHIDAINDTAVTVKLTSGNLVEIPRNAIAPSDNGAVLGVSAEELDRKSVV